MYENVGWKQQASPSVTCWLTTHLIPEFGEWQEVDVYQWPERRQAVGEQVTRGEIAH